MKAPDKIFVRDFGNSLCKMWTYEKGKKKDDVDLVYVRKEALVEWASNLYEKTMTFVTGDATRDQAVQLFALNIKKHIESL